MQTEQATVLSESHFSLACFGVRDCLYAIDVAQVREIVRCREVTPLPKAPALIEGVVDLRGAVVPVLDLGRVLGGDPVVEGPQARIVILELDGLVVGLRVESAVDVLAVPAGGLEDPPALATHAGYDMVRAVVRRDRAAPVMVISLEHVFESVYRSAIGERGDEG